VALNSYSANGLCGFYFYEKGVLKSIFQHRCSNAANGNWFVFGGYANDVNVGLLTGGMKYPDDYRLIVDNHGNVVINEGGGNCDFRIEGDNEPDLFFVDASTNRVGINTTNPQYELDVEGYVQAHGYYTGDIFFQKDGKKLWRMFEDENGLYVENIQTGEIYSLLSKDTEDHSLGLTSMFLMAIIGAMGVAIVMLWKRKDNL